MMKERLLKEDSGFTLIELLVTISILAVLFGVVSLALTGVGSGAESTVNDAELGVVQSAADIYMAANNLSSVTAQAVAACLDGTEDFGGYLRLSGGSSKCEYSWTAAGVITQAGGCTSATC